MQVELTKINGSYVNQLQANIAEINNKFSDRTVSTQQLKQIVRDIVIDTNDKSLNDKSPATKRFLDSLEKQKSKDGIIMLVYNAQLKGDGLGVI